MTTNKKLVVTVGVMAIALILALTGIIVVLVTANQRASSAVNVKYTSSDVAVTLSATAYLGGNTHQFTKGGVVGGETELVLSPTVTEGSLSQTSDIASFDLTKTNDYVVFEYVFQNKTGNIDVKIDQDGIPATKENINLTYTYSDTKITNFADLEDNATFTAQLVPAYTGEETIKYVYIKAQIADLLYDSSLVGDFGWALSKPQDSEINTVTLSVSGADLVERSGSNLTTTSVTSDYTYKTLASTVDVEDISIVPAVINKAFIGWSETNGGSVISTIDMPSVYDTHNALRGTTATTLYPVYKDGNVTMDTTATRAFVLGLTDRSSTEAVIPDITTHEGSIVKITKIDSYAFQNCTGLTGITIPASVTLIESFVFQGCTSLTSITIPNSVTSIGPNAFQECTGLTSITISDNVTSIGDYAFLACGLTSITIPSSVTDIGYGAFYACNELVYIAVESGNTVYDSRDNCNAIIQTTTNTLVRGCRTTVIPSTVIGLNEGAFYGCGSLTSITIPASVVFVDLDSFLGCGGLLSANGGEGVTFEDTSGWTYSGEAIDVTNPQTNAQNFISGVWSSSINKN